MNINIVTYDNGAKVTEVDKGSFKMKIEIPKAKVVKREKAKGTLQDVSDKLLKKQRKESK